MFEPAAKRAKAANGLAVAANGKKHEESSSEEDSSSDEEAAPTKNVAAGWCLFVSGGTSKPLSVYLNGWGR